MCNMYIPLIYYTYTWLWFRHLVYVDILKADTCRILGLQRTSVIVKVIAEVLIWFDVPAQTLQGRANSDCAENDSGCQVWHDRDRHGLEQQDRWHAVPRAGVLGVFSRISFGASAWMLGL